MLVWLKPLLAGLVVGIIGLILWIQIFGKIGRKKEIESNKHSTPPDENHLKWDIRHIRQDIMSLTRLLFFIFIVLLFILVK